MRISIKLNESAIKKIDKAYKESALTAMESLKADVMDTVPLDQGGLQNSMYVDSRETSEGTHIFLDHDMLYARYLYFGNKMVDSKTGKGPALIHDKTGGEVGYRYRKGAKLKVKQPNEKLKFKNGRTDHWLQPYVYGPKKEFLRNALIAELKRRGVI